MRIYKHSNGRVMARESNGRFRNFSLRDFGFEVNTSYMVYGNCGYGEKDKWIPVLKTGKCPMCGNQDNHRVKEIPLSKEAEVLMERIDELENKIGKAFVHPLMLNEYGGELRRLQYELEHELNRCIDNTFKEQG